MSYEQKSDTKSFSFIPNLPFSLLKVQLIKYLEWHYIQKKSLVLIIKNNDFVKPLLQGQQTPVSEGEGAKPPAMFKCTLD